MGVVQIIAPIAAPIVSERHDISVQVKKKWADEWEPVAYLQALTATATIAPGIPSSEFLWRYGDIKREDANVFAFVDPLNIANYYVQILIVNEFGSTAIWTGIISDESFRIQGVQAAGKPQGDQTIVAYGLEHLLDRNAIIGAFVEESGVTKEIGWSPTFNDRGYRGASLDGNRSSAIGPEGVHRFSRDGVAWSHRDILEHVLKFYPITGLTFSLGGQADLLDNIFTVVNFEGLTLRQVLNKLIDRKRGTGWTIRTTGVGIITIHVFSVFDEAVSVGEVIALPNEELVTIIFDQAIDINTAIINKSMASQYDKIIVQGEKIKVCFTVSIDDGNLEEAWTGAEEVAYAAGSVSNNTDAKKNDAERKTDKFKRVYQVFRIPSNWNWKAGSGVGGTETLVIPGLTTDGRIDLFKVPATWNYPKALLRWIPIAKEAGATKSEPEYLEPMVFVKDGTDYHQVENLAAIKKDPASVRALDREMGIEVTPKINHVFGLNFFFKTTDPKSNTDPQIDYTTMITTVCAEADQRLRVEVDIDVPGRGEALKTLIIEVPDAELWWINPTTATGVTDGKLVHHSGGVLRDDSARLRQMAALAKAWYGKRRSAIELSISALVQFAPVGSLIVSAVSGIQEEPVGTVVSSKIWDFTTQGTSFKTDYSEIDISAASDIPGMSDFRSVGRQFAKQKREIKELRKHVGNLVVRRPTASVISEPAAGIPVDFIMDDFIRADADTLGDNWIDGDSYSIRGNSALPQHAFVGGISVHSFIESVDNLYIGLFDETPDRDTVHISRPIHTPASTEVRARDFLSSFDGNIKVGFSLVGPLANGNPGRYFNLFFRGDRKTGSGVSLGFSVEPGIGNYTATGSTSFPECPQITSINGFPITESAQAQLSITDNATYLLLTLKSYQKGFSAVANIPHTIEPPFSVATQSPDQSFIASCLTKTGAIKLTVPAHRLEGMLDQTIEHTFEVNYSGTSYAVKFDGVVVFSGTQNHVLSGDDVGLIASDNFVPNPTTLKINYFKAWIDGIAEPKFSWEV